VYLGQINAWCGDTEIELGAQDVAAFGQGAYTGEVSASMLADLRCAWALVGHSERRSLLGETDTDVATKISQLAASGVGAIACVGETLEEREAGRTLEVIARQIDAIAPELAKLDPARAVVAYEPVWAIGTGRTASAEQAQQVHAAIRTRLGAAGLEADRVRLLYGGSMKPGNAAELLAQPDVDGGLIGGASLVADDFTAICRAALG
jgi:triosephosphate isomerase